MNLEALLSSAAFARTGLDLAVSKAWQKKKADAGWACLHWPKQYGGVGATPIERVIWGQEEAAYAALNTPFIIGQGMCGPTLLAWGGEEHKQRYLPALATGDEIWCQLFSEPAGGSDLAGLRTRAERATDGSSDWIINGQKIWTSGAQHADMGLLLTRTDPGVAKHKGLTMFFVNMRIAGIEMRPIKQANGHARFSEVYFSDVRVPDSQRLGAINQGWEVSLTTLMNERLSIGAGMSLGFSELFTFCMHAEIDGKPALDNAAVRSRLANYAVRSSGLKYTSMRAITALSKGQTPGPENSISKLVAGATMQELAMFALDLQGPAGVVMDPDSPSSQRFQAMLLRSPATRLEGGTDEILRNIIAERVLGLPQDIRVDKNIPFKDIPTRGRT
jgi:acyl-CoA dehydrogenase